MHETPRTDRYNEWADLRSWESAYHFVNEAFGITAYEKTQPDAASVTPVNYTGVDGAALRGYLAMPADGWQRPLPAVIIVPDWDGVNTYEQERATALAELGYVAFAADIFGADLQEDLDIPLRIELVTNYSTNPDLYVSRIQSAIDQVKMLDSDVAIDEIAIIGYCFGGSVRVYSITSSR